MCPSMPEPHSEPGRPGGEAGDVWNEETRVPLYLPGSVGNCQEGSQVCTKPRVHSNWEKLDKKLAQWYGSVVECPMWLSDA